MSRSATPVTSLISTDGRLGLTTGDVMIVLAVLSVALALVYPSLLARSFRASVEEMITDVETVRASAERHFADTGEWPASAPVGTLPLELQGAFGGSLPGGDEYTLEWSRWDIVDYVEAPPAADPNAADQPPDSVAPELIPIVRSVGGVLVYSGDDDRLGELLARYGREASFVRDTVWTLVLSGHDRGGG